MRVILPFHAGDAPEAVTWMRWVKEISPKINAAITLAYDDQTPANLVMQVQSLAVEVFQSVALLKVKHVCKWPDGPNAMFRAAATACRSQPFLWMEPDAIPLKPNWHEAIAAEYAACGKKFMGHIYRCHDPRFPERIMSGIAVYPADAITLVPVLPHSPLAWEIEAAEIMVANGAHTSLISHFWGQPGKPPVFVPEDMTHKPINAFLTKQIPSAAVVWHRNKDGSLIEQLSAGKIAQQRVKLGTAIVTLRRAGDIVSLLPLVRAISTQERARIRLVVHKDFAPILDGVSYAEAISWTGNWEEPLAAAATHKALNAQVAGRGVITNYMGGNFARDAWKLLGKRWNRYLPLDFDLRDKEREQALCEKIVKSDKPLLLVKMRGFSSPFVHAEEAKRRLTVTHGERCEVVCLDDVQASRLYDVIALMDRAACLVSIDTVSLHLASASPVPVIAFTNGTMFGASPARGNVVLRMPYAEVLARWAEVDGMIDRCVAGSGNTNIVHAYSYFTPSDPETRRRNEAAFNTWGSLGARLAPFTATRTSGGLGDPRQMPYVRDLVGHAFSGTEDICVISNNDIQFDVKLRGAILSACEKFGCYWSYRLDRPGGVTDQGADVFAFTRKWWLTHNQFLPDFLLGYYCWDDVLVRLMLWSGCREQPRLHYHEPHPGTSSHARLHSPGHTYNERLMREWCHTHGDDWEKPADRRV